jgi:hypothetical protein
MEPEYIAGLLVMALIGLAGFMIRNYFSSWETRMIAQDDRLDDHDNKYTDHAVQIATIKANMEHIRATGDETSADVKKLLRRPSGNRSTG